jgi:hypothetical protein
VAKAACVTRRSVIPVVLGAVALVAAVALALLAAEVRRTDDNIRQADRRFEVASESGNVWKTAHGVRSRVARSLLGTGDDLAWRKATRLFEAAQGVLTAAPGHPDQLRAEATIALERVDKGDGDIARRARTANMLGVMAYEDAAISAANASSLLRRAADLFRNSIRMDPASAAAKFNLELLLRLESEQTGAFSTGSAIGGAGALTGAKPTGHGY